MTGNSQEYFVYINGHSGVGKLTVANELKKLLPNSRVVGNHDLIDPVAGLHGRTAPEYNPTCRIFRRVILGHIAQAEPAGETTWIFTDQQSANEKGSSIAGEYQLAAEKQGLPFISVILTCELGENVRRVVGDHTSMPDSKMIGLSGVCMIEAEEEIFYFENEMEIELDITDVSPEESARRILEHIHKMTQCQK